MCINVVGSPDVVIARCPITRSRLLWSIVSVVSVKWTEVLSAFASVASTTLSIIAAVFAYYGVRAAWRSFEVQRKQLNESAELRERQHAANFCVWLEDLGDSWAMMLHNAGDMPVCDVYVSWNLGDPVTWSDVIGEMREVSNEERAGLLGEWEFGNVGPTSEPRCEDGVGDWVREGAAHCVDVLNRRDHGRLFLPGLETAFKNIRLTTVFTDVAGVRWERRGGQLQRQDDWFAAQADQPDSPLLVPAAG